VEFEGKTALVTGASRGIGKAIAGDLSSNGAFVIGTSTTQEGANRVTEDLTKVGEGVGFVLNVSEQASVDRMFEGIRDYDAPLILVNNAAITRDNIALRMKDEEWDDVLDTNLTSTFRVTKKILRGMTKQRWGRIINISSVVGSMGNAGQSNYAAAKAGLEGFSRALATELGSRGITINCVAPGLIDTDMTEALSDQQREALLARVPAGRFGNATEIAALVTFLAGERAAYITGETIHINGGMYMG
jgi:3-oxoacyl-[acyl-carrier protein] reductase|tara:strand:- start:19709 stop:20446 length:738 start_codon:yes stop_codon:yes gene_type:complete